MFANKPEYCPYRHSPAPSTAQKISWLPCVYELTREAESQGLGHDAMVRNV